MSDDDQLDWDQLPISSLQMIGKNIMNALGENKVFIFGCAKGERCVSCSSTGKSQT